MMEKILCLLKVETAKDCCCVPSIIFGLACSAYVCTYYVPQCKAFFATAKKVMILCNIKKCTRITYSDGI